MLTALPGGGRFFCFVCQLLLLLLSSGASVLQKHRLDGTEDAGGEARFLFSFTPLASTLGPLPHSRAILFAAV
jgi:hypothetical protein